MPAMACITGEAPSPPKLATAPEATLKRLLACTKMLPMPGCSAVICSGSPSALSRPKVSGYWSSTA